MRRPCRPARPRYRSSIRTFVQRAFTLPTTMATSRRFITQSPNYRSTESHIRLTAEQPMSFAIGETKDMTFTFADPIPLDATDLTLEAYFRGTVGGEAGTFALGAADLSEPTFIAVMNATDVFELNGTAFYYPDDIINGIAKSP